MRRGGWAQGRWLCGCLCLCCDPAELKCEVEALQRCVREGEVRGAALEAEARALRRRDEEVGGRGAAGACGHGSVCLSV